MVIIVKSKGELDIAAAKSQTDYWMKLNYAYQGNFEMQYRDISPKILIEKYLEEENGNLYDYKVHCFNGEPLCVQVVGDRDFEGHTNKQVFLDLDYKIVPYNFKLYPEYEKIPKKPNNWTEIIDLASKLAAGFCYVRVDLYSVNGKIYFGEMTFTPDDGLHPNWDPGYDREWGDKIELPGTEGAWKGE